MTPTLPQLIADLRATGDDRLFDHLIAVVEKQAEENTHLMTRPSDVDHWADKEEWRERASTLRQATDLATQSLLAAWQGVKETA